jgi:dTDP-4-dehydrorhamnose 3,5-epimerase
MLVNKTPIKGLLVITPDVYKDDRGYFYESFSTKKYANHGIGSDFVQDNESYSTYGTIRGLHFQRGEFAQSKLVRVIEGKILDVAVDLRQSSASFGKWYSIILDDKSKKQFFIPKGFAHGFSVLSETARFAYKCDNFYHKESESGIAYDDPALAIDWMIDAPIVSEKDKVLPRFNNLKTSDLELDWNQFRGSEDPVNNMKDQEKSNDLGSR